MECILGAHIVEISRSELERKTAGQQPVLVDLGTGDGRFVLAAARADPTLLAIGLDACRENLHRSSRKAPDNALFAIANALDVPGEMHGLATEVTINFPWGSLLAGLLADPETLLGRLFRPDARPSLTVRLNEGALTEQGVRLEEGAQVVWDRLRWAGYRLKPWRGLEAEDLRRCPSTWARRLAFGRAPRGAVITTREDT
jgi:16S rRNA (adenine(1408)-N(1))-methyltransferase